MFIDDNHKNATLPITLTAPGVIGTAPLTVDIASSFNLVNTFKKMVREGATVQILSKQFKEEELIEIGKEYGFEWLNKELEIVISLENKINQKNESLSKSIKR